MGEISKIEDLRIWQNARTISRMIYAITRREEFVKDFRFVQQIRAAAGSIMDNIAEGFGRGGNKEFLQFLSIARGSSQELLSQIYRAYDAQYINEEEFTDCRQLINNTSVMIHNLMEQIKKSDIKGVKYNSKQLLNNC